MNTLGLVFIALLPLNAPAAAPSNNPPAAKDPAQNSTKMICPVLFLHGENFTHHLNTLNSSANTR